MFLSVPVYMFKYMCVCMCVCVCLCVCVLCVVWRVCHLKTLQRCKACWCVCVCEENMCVCHICMHVCVCLHKFHKVFSPPKSCVHLDMWNSGRGMGWLQLVGSLKLQVSFANEPYKRDYILRKRHVIWRSLLIIAIPYHLLSARTLTDISLSLYMSMYVAL